MQFVIPIVWREQKNHYDYCCFCLIDITRISSKNKHTIVYPDLESARRPIPHDISLPIPIPMPQQINFESEMVEDLEFAVEEVHTNYTDLNYVPEDELLAPQTFSQGESNDLIRGLDLFKEKAELLASRLKQKNLLDKDVLISHYRKRNLDLAQHFTTDRNCITEI